MTNKEKETARQATASPIGGYCLAFVEVLRRKRKGISPPVEMLEEFARCESIAEGLGKYEECLKYMERSA